MRRLVVVTKARDVTCEAWHTAKPLPLRSRYEQVHTVAE